MGMRKWLVEETAREISICVELKKKSQGFSRSKRNCLLEERCADAGYPIQGGRFLRCMDKRTAEVWWTRESCQLGLSLFSHPRILRRWLQKSVAFLALIAMNYWKSVHAAIGQ